MILCTCVIYELRPHSTLMAGAGVKMNSVVFYYDVVCPFAYMASRLVERMGQRANAIVTWRPVLLGGLYEATLAPQGKGGSSMDVMSPAKLRITGNDLHRQMRRLKVPYREPSNHPQKTVYAMRMLAGIADNQLRASLSHDLYRAYWCEARDVADLSVLQEVASSHGVDASQLVHSDEASQLLRANTAEAAKRGAFGVPSFYVGGRLYWGTDRLFLVEQALGLHGAEPECLMSPQGGGTARLTFFFDYSSPWAYLGCMRLQHVLEGVAPVQVEVEWVPILLGALFKQIGTPIVPLAVLSEAKQRYMQQDFSDWCEYASVPLHWPDAFPLRTVLPLRVTLAAGCDPKLIRALYVAAWQNNLDIGTEKVVGEVLVEGGWDAGRLLHEAQSTEIKAKLHSTTSRAVEEGLCGVPTFQVNQGPLVWGQDRLNVVADMLCGWQDQHPAKL